MYVLTVTHNPADRPQSASTRRGATLMEYLLVLSLIGVACIVGIGYFGTETSNLTQGAQTAINRTLSAAPGTNVLPSGGILPGGSGDEGDDSKDKKKDGKTKDGTTK